MHPLDLSRVASGPQTPAAKTSNRRSSDVGEDFEFDRPKSNGRPPILAIGLLLGAAIAGYVISSRHDFLLGQIASPILGLLGFHGLWRGGLRKLVMLPVSAGVIGLLASKPDFADPAIRAVAGQSSGAGNFIACALAFIILMSIVSAMVRWVRKRFIMKKSVLRATDRFFGAGIGLAEGLFIVLSICWAAIIVEPQAKNVVNADNVPAESFRYKFAGSMIRLVDEIDRTQHASTIRKANLLEKVPGLREALQGIESGEGPFNLDAIDPELREAALELIKNQGGEAMGGLGEQIQRRQDNAESRNKAYNQLPASETDKER